MEENYYEAQGAVDPAYSVTFALFLIAFAFILLIAQWRIFQKAGKPGWAAVVPVYNLYVHLQIVGKPGWWMLLFFIPFVNFYVAIRSVHLLSKSFGKDIGFTLGLLFLPFIFYPVLGFGSATYLGPYGDRDAFAAYQRQIQFEFEKAG